MDTVTAKWAKRHVPRRRRSVSAASLIPASRPGLLSVGPSGLGMASVGSQITAGLTMASVGGRIASGLTMPSAGSQIASELTMASAGGQVPRAIGTHAYERREAPAEDSRARERVVGIRNGNEA